MTTAHNQQIEANEFLISPGIKRKPQAEQRRPTLNAYAATYKKYGFIPFSNCTTWTQFAALMLNAMGVPTDKFFISLYNYDASWITEHWVIAVNIDNRWYCLDPQHGSTITKVPYCGDPAELMKMAGVKKAP